MTLIKTGNNEWLLVDERMRVAAGDRDTVIGVLTPRLAVKLAFGTMVDAPLSKAREEVTFAIDCMERNNHDVAYFGIWGHFIYSSAPEVIEETAA